jgi:hydroxyacylglutathione hydrolase
VTRTLQIALLAVLVHGACAMAAGLSSPPLAPVELNRRLAHPDPPLVVDVRSPDLHSAGHIPGAVNIPAPLLRKKLVELSQAEELVLYCNDSRLTRIAEQILVKNRVQRFSHLEGGFNAWENEKLPVETSLR